MKGFALGVLATFLITVTHTVHASEPAKHKDPELTPVQTQIVSILINHGAAIKETRKVIGRLAAVLMNRINDHEKRLNRLEKMMKNTDSI